jgi:enhancing lycopene biosynthesis protein 2
VILSGCGFKDGSEIHESVCSLLALDQLQIAYQCFAPDILQSNVVNHITGHEMKQERNVLVEAARIARGNIKSLSNCDVNQYDGLVLPGGFGAAQNLSSFATQGASCSVIEDLKTIVLKFHQQQKPIGALCIAPVILAHLIPGAKLTIGDNKPLADNLNKMGAIHQNTSFEDVIVDPNNRLVSTPCYMLDASISQIANGAKNLVQAMLKI